MGQLMDQGMDLGMGIRHIYPPPDFAGADDIITNWQRVWDQDHQMLHVSLIVTFFN